MKSYFLEGLNDEDQVRDAISGILPTQSEPWILKDDKADVIAYFNLDRAPDGLALIQADISGRHFDCDEPVLDVLRTIRSRCGGTITDNDDAPIG